MTSCPDTDRVLTLDDLEDWSRLTPSLAVIGHPIAHSRSPLMHNAALAKLGESMPQFREWAYYKFDIPPERLAHALPLFYKHNFVGLNLTIPHKVDVVSLVCGMSSQGRAAGALNTLLRQDDGYYGHNTDGLGFARACESRLGVRLRGANVVLLGAGGSARAVAAAALEAGCKSLWIGNRDPHRLAGLIAQLEPLAKGECRPRPFAPGAPPADLPPKSLLVNCTSLGLRPDDPSPFPSIALMPGMTVYDIVYGASPSALLREARALGLPAEDGLSMLCWQGALALELWTRTHVPVEVMWKAIGGSGPIE